MAATTKAEDRKFLAEAKAAEAEAALFEAQARERLADARKSEIALERLKEDRAEELASDRYHQVYRFASSVNETSVAACMAVLGKWSRLKPGCDIEVVFTSPGGSVLHGFALFDFLRSLSRQGHKIITTDLGYSASMAGILLQAGDLRRMGKESYFHIHEISTGAIGKIGEIEDAVDFANKMMTRVVEIFVERSGGKITAAKLRKMYERKEAWFSSEEALKYGLVDEVL